MINLLPPQQQQEILENENYRLILILGAIFLLFLVCLSLILLSLNIYLDGQAESQGTIVAAEQAKFKNSQAKLLEAEINSANRSLSQINNFYKSQPNWTKALEIVSSALPENTSLTFFSLSPVAKEENKFQVSLTGVSADRETLFEFKNNLEEESVFEEIYFPPASWVDPTNFTVTFKIGL